MPDDILLPDVGRLEFEAGLMHSLVSGWRVSDTWTFYFWYDEKRRTSFHGSALLLHFGVVP